MGLVALSVNEVLMSPLENLLDNNRSGGDRCGGNMDSLSTFNRMFYEQRASSTSSAKAGVPKQQGFEACLLVRDDDH